MYTLSKIIPVRMQSTYADYYNKSIHSTWWQWRGRIWWHKQTVV